MYKASPEAYRLREVIEESKEPVLVMGIGISGSQRSRILEQAAWLGGPNQSAINVEAIRERFVRFRVGSHLAEYVDREVRRRVQNDLISHGVALVDSANIEGLRRTVDVARYRKVGAATIGAIVMDIPHDAVGQMSGSKVTSLETEHFRQMQTSLQEQLPSHGEGFDWIMTVKPGEPITVSRV